MKIKTSELTGAALDFAVAKCKGVRLTQRIDSFAAYGAVIMQKGGVYSPSSNWSQGGPIIERELIEVTPIFYSAGYEHPAGSWQWRACLLGQNNIDENFEAFGTTLLIAAMRCYVASKLGDEVEIPDEIC